MKRHFTLNFIVIICSTLLLVQSGCATPTVSEQEKSKTDLKKITIKLAHWSTSSAEVIDHIFEEYNKKNNKNISVETIKIPSDKVDETINLMFTSGQSPDIFGVDQGKIKAYETNGWLADLSKYTNASFLSRFPSYAVKSARSYAKNGEFYTIASIADTYRLIYNRDLFRKAGLNPDNPPNTIAKVRAYARKISDTCKNENKYGFALPAAEDWATFTLAMEYPASYSGLYAFDYKEGKYDLTAFKPWIQFFIDMKNDGSLFPGELFLKNDTARIQFAEGNIGMMFAGSWDPSVFDSQFPAKCDWDVTLPPALDEQSIHKGALIMKQGWSWGVSIKTENMDKAIEVWKFLYSEEFLGELFSKGCILPIVNGIKNNTKYKPVMKNFDKFFPTEKDSPYPNAPFITDEISPMQYYKDAFSGKKSIDESLQAGSLILNSRLEEAVKKKQLSIEDYKNSSFEAKNPTDNY